MTCILQNDRSKVDTMLEEKKWNEVLGQDNTSSPGVKNRDGGRRPKRSLHPKELQETLLDEAVRGKIIPHRYPSYMFS